MCIRDRFLTHLKYFAQRFLHKELHYDENQELFKIIKEQYREAYGCVKMIYLMMEEEYKLSLIHIYFTLRSGGKTIITFLFDSVFIWCVSVPIAFVLSRYTGIHVLVIYACVQLADLIKCVIGFVLVKKGVWLQNIVSS